MDAAGTRSRYWCYSCHQMVNPIREVEDVKCPLCQGGFVEEVDGGGGATDGHAHDPDSDFSSDRNLSLWAPILLGMMGNTRRQRRFRRTDFEEDYDYSDEDGEARRGGEVDNHLDRELESIIRRRRRSSAAILQLLQGLRSGTENSLGDSDRERARYRDRERYRDRYRDRERERVILINPSNEAIMVHGYDSNGNGESLNETPIGSLGDYFVGPGLDLLLQHLAENDPNRYGTPPAQKEVIEALPTVLVKETVQCSVCLDDFEIGSEAKEMPCKHKFHSGCILPWLELHSSCPVCRFQLPTNKSAFDPVSEATNHGGSNNNEGSTSHESSGEEAEGEGRNGGRRFSFPWPFSGLFSSPNASNSSATPLSPSAANTRGSGTNSSETYEN
ncbi:unnamed protein product [Linum tenue]|uniref:RING-type E3 ubiquitin transferase n=1 Tax=Linum tenue TaxID=586396 RepID=A0AAV0M3P7_9ROSI|nr:unnamed protein product [Linum tenue]